MSQTLKSLEDRYLKMKRKILEGVPLDNLKLLSVDTKRLTAETCYSPSLVCKVHMTKERKKLNEACTFDKLSFCFLQIYEAFLSDHLPESSFK